MELLERFPVPCLILNRRLLGKRPQTHTQTRERMEDSFTNRTEIQTRSKQPNLGSAVQSLHFSKEPSGVFLFLLFISSVELQRFLSNCLVLLIYLIINDIPIGVFFFFIFLLFLVSWFLLFQWLYLLFWFIWLGSGLKRTSVAGGWGCVRWHEVRGVCVRFSPLIRCGWRAYRVAMMSKGWETAPSYPTNPPYHTIPQQIYTLVHSHTKLPHHHSLCITHPTFTIYVQLLVEGPIRNCWSCRHKEGTANITLEIPLRC